jgi:hypothetical protein
MSTNTPTVTACPTFTIERGPFDTNLEGRPVYPIVMREPGQAEGQVVARCDSKAEARRWIERETAAVTARARALAAIERAHQAVAAELERCREVGARQHLEETATALLVSIAAARESLRVARYFLSRKG